MDSLFTNITTSTNHQCRCKLPAQEQDSSMVAIRTRLSRQESFRRDVGHAAAETFLLTRLTFTLLRYLGVGRLPVDQQIPCPYFLCHASYAWFSSRSFNATG